ncbi:unnamed protein product [Rhizoctonia solani]|uniref:Uncharacterized protein n=1 Tax=Rhizoctonia solani TaxID=456999 RepID=A0A8H2WQK4_9AGAM|nr:unnamed protein product [Rhizoctonia solani]CAE6394952.1 unnamed protein product [Rhizoctonia solani]
MRALKESTAGLKVFETPREFGSRQRRAAAKAQQSQSTEPAQITELQHRKVKAQWDRTNMKEAVPQMIRIGDIGDTLRTIQDRLDRLEARKLLPDNSRQPSVPYYVTAPDMTAYCIGQSDRSEDAFNLPLWVHNNRRDFALKFFIPLLKEHLLTRIPGAHQLADIGKVNIQNDRIYSHATLRVNYTSYDVCRQQDTINPRSPCRFITLPADTSDTNNLAGAHPFLYAKVLGIYHAYVRFDRRPARRMNFLWVRWLDCDEDEPGGWDECRLDRVFYSKCRNENELMNAFGFVAPHHVIRAAHLIPDFESGTTDLPGFTSFGDNEQNDWKYHYVSIDIDEEAEELDISEGYDVEADPNAEQDEWWAGDDGDEESDGIGSDDESDDELDDGFIRDLYDF